MPLTAHKHRVGQQLAAAAKGNACSENDVQSGNWASHLLAKLLEHKGLAQGRGVCKVGIDPAGTVCSCTEYSASRVLNFCLRLLLHFFFCLQRVFAGNRLTTFVSARRNSLIVFLRDRSYSVFTCEPRRHAHTSDEQRTVRNDSSDDSVPVTDKAADVTALLSIQRNKNALSNEVQ